MLKKIRYLIEAFFLLLALAFFRLLPLDIASALGGWLARVVGPFLRAHRVARNNITRVMPELGERQRAKILRDMWDNLGRVAGEYPHLSRKIMRQRITIEGLEHLQALKDSTKGAVFVSGHFANWEIIPITANLCGLPLTVIYRAANNPYADAIIRRIRSSYNQNMHRKGYEGAIQSLKALRRGEALGMLVDQKLNNGKAIPFFGVEAMTTPAATGMAIKYGAPLLAAHAVRTDGAYFHVTLSPAIHYPQDADPIKAMEDINKVLESWVRAQPAQWFWVHNRWNWGRMPAQATTQL